MKIIDFKNIPETAGVYIFKDDKGRILYIGKAKLLKSRVRYYFNRPLPVKIQVMVSKIDSIEYILTKSEAEAMLCEAKLIRERLPPYNTVFRDDKSFPYISISDDKFPVVFITRKVNKDVNTGIIKSKFKRRVYYFGPYPNVKLLRHALKTIRSVFGFRSCYKMPSRACLYHRLGLCSAPCIGKCSIKGYQDIIRNIILFLEGKHQDLFYKLASKMRHFSSKMKFEEAARIRDQIMSLSSIIPQQYEFEMGNSIKNDVFSRSSRRESLELKRVLGLKKRPRHIEAFDVSNISGSSACASMVYFYEGMPDKKNYRRFRIKSVSGIDDYQMLKEAVTRRYLRVKEEKLPLADLIIIDGGKGHLSVVRKQLEKMGLDVPVVSIAKQQEEIFSAGCKAGIKLKKGTIALSFIQRVRDEAHRFALAYHHILRKKKMLGT